MIIILPAEKDTYVTNLKTQNIDASLSNVGKAATLDIFKLYNENKNAKSEISIKFNEDVNNDIIVQNNDIFSFEDARNNVVKLIIDNTVNTNDGSTKLFNNEDHVIIGTLNLTTQQLSEQISTVINNINSNVNNNKTLHIDAYSNSNNELVLRQKFTGESGDTQIIIPDSNFIEVSHSSKYFSRKDKSCILIKFDLESFINDFKFLGDNLDFENSALNNLTAKVVLRDVTSGHVKPKDFVLSTFKLLKDFDEGIGKDTIKFADKNIAANFININESEQWEIPSYVSKGTDIESVSIESKVFLQGDEDLEIDVTEHIKDVIQNQADNFGYLIQIEDSFLKDEYTYFVKRFGSRHLINKSLSPVLQISIPDYQFGITDLSYDIRYFNTEEDFYLFNMKNEEFVDLSLQDYTLKLKFLLNDNKTIIVDDISSTTIKNYRGIDVPGIKKASVNNMQISQFNELIKPNIKNDIAEIYGTWYWENDNDANDILDVHTKKFYFYKTSKQNMINFSNNIVSKVVVKNKELISKNYSVSQINAYFLDSKENLDAVNVPIELVSKNLGSVFYQIVNLNDNSIIVDYSSDELFFDGVKYILNLHIPEIYKNSLLSFNFKLEDTRSGNTYLIKNKESFRVK